MPLAVFVAVAAVFGVLAVASWILYDRTEQRLLEQRMHLAAGVLELNLTNIETPLVGAAQVAAVTSGDPVAFSTVTSPFVGDGRTFSAVALYRVAGGRLVHSEGEAVAMHADGDEGVVTTLRRAAAAAGDPARGVAVVDLLDDAGGRRVGYATADSTGTFVVYGQRLLHPDPYLRQRTEEAFTSLDYAIYLGDREDESSLLGASRSGLPLRGRTASVLLPFGDRERLMVVTPIGHLSGGLFARLWWIVGVVGATVAAGFATMAARLERRRDRGFALAAENARLYDEQRRIAETLQLSLLPGQLDVPAGTEVAARYWPAGASNLIGGDFYDVFHVAGRRWGLVIGDVCGKGLAAATLTGLSRHTARAAARQAKCPSEVLRAVDLALRDLDPPTYCTAAFAFVELGSHGEGLLTLALGGHPSPLLRRADGTVAEVGAPGTLLGMVDTEFVDIEVAVDPGDLLLMYTDGLTDAPGAEAVELSELVGLLRRRGDVPVERLAEEIRALELHRRPRGSGDDTALVLVRF